MISPNNSTMQLKKDLEVIFSFQVKILFQKEHLLVQSKHTAMSINPLFPQSMVKPKYIHLIVLRKWHKEFVFIVISSQETVGITIYSLSTRSKERSSRKLSLRFTYNGFPHSLGHEEQIWLCLVNCHIYKFPLCIQ